MLARTKRYMATIVGACVIVGVVTVGILHVGSNTVGRLVETAMKDKGKRFADLLVGEDGVIDAFLTGVSRNSDTELTIRNIAALSNIDSFSIFDRNGAEVFGSRSDRYKWLLRDRPGGMTSGDRISDQVRAVTGEWQIVYDDGKANPSVVSPLIRNGATIGYVSVLSDVGDDRASYQQVVAGTSISLLTIVAFATGLPLLFYLRRQRLMAEADERIQFLANHDPLTRLLNRTRMQEEVERVLAMSRATREAMAFLFIDIDRMSDINDGLGQAHGDTLIRVVAERITAIVDADDMVARLGADDFAILQRRAMRAGDVANLARRLKQAVGEPLEIGGQTIRPQISIGVAMMPKDGRTHGELVKHAELALFNQKTLRKGDYTVFDMSMDDEMHRRREIELKVRNALETNGFELFYQPIMKGDGSRILGFEALIRMPDGNGGHISPVDFIPIAEARGYIKGIGNWVIGEAARQAAKWPDHIFVSVNLSPVQFRDGDLVEIVSRAIAAAGIKGHRLEMEVVESLVLDNSAEILGQLEALKKLGMSIAMDDFGTGYSSLGYLWRFPFDKLKIDQSFMRALAGGEKKVPEIVATIISLGHHLHMKVTAEGVETGEQADWLAELGCDQIQGYHYGKPMSARTVDVDFLPRFAPDGSTPRQGLQTAIRPLADVA